MSLFDQIGGDKLRAVVTDFYARVLADHMIGYMFDDAVRKLGKDHLIEREWELVANLLGAEGVKYQGRTMRGAHGRHAIFVGFFDRRLTILKETLRDHAVAQQVQDKWLSHTESLRNQIVHAKPDPLAPAPAEPSVIKLGRRPAK
ncbi:MAG TPA: hypothetical protein VGM90_04425 [Kofleriaceae bacterium]|jgi:truncated hemoglobin YjbI